MNEYDIARVCHEVNRAYCQAIGDDSQLSWEDAPKWQAASTISGVRAVLGRALSAEETHNHWMKEKVDDGWKWGLVKDVLKKTHPCIMPYTSLPKEQQVKDHLFRAVVEILRDRTS